MTTQYISGLTEAECEKISRTMWLLSAPRSLYVGSKTTYAVNWNKHPTRDEYTLVMPSDYVLQAHPKTKQDIQSVTDDEGIKAELRAAIYSKSVKTEEQAETALIAAIDANMLTVGKITEQFNPAQVKTKDEMDADGWFPVIVMA